MPLFKNSIVTITVICLLVTPFSNAQTPVDNNNTHPGKFYTVEKKYDNSTVDGYNMYVPNSCTTASKAFPVIVFFQGGLGVGGKVDAIFNWELPKLMKETNNLESELNKLMLNTFVYVMPHISRGQFYGNENAISEILKEVTTKYNVDENRIYLTGLSRGGHGTWGVASRMPAGTFKAIAPVSGSPDGVTNYETLAKLPVWTAHNTGDEVVRYNGTFETVQKIEAITGKKFHRAASVSEADYKNNDRIFISGNSNGHNAWMELYTNVNFYKWLLRF